MRKILLATVLAAAALAILPERSLAGNRDPNNYGYGWLGALAYRTKPRIHQAPLFNYGPYNTQGLVTMHIPQPYHGTYTPADQSLWNRTNYGIPQNQGYGPYQYGQGMGYPQYPQYQQYQQYQPGPVAPRVVPAYYPGR